MISAPSLSGAALLVGLSLFLGFAFEDFFAHSNIRRPGGIRTFPILATRGRRPISSRSPPDWSCWAFGSRCSTGSMSASGSLSYASYLAQRYWAAAARGLWMAALGGLYSSTATTVVLARQAKADVGTRVNAQAGITLATAIMYLRILAIVAFFNRALAEQLATWPLRLSASGLVICALQYRFAPRPPEKAEATGLRATGGNPLELGPAMLFSALFVAVSLVSNWAKAEFGTSGIYTLAAIVGVTDI